MERFIDLYSFTAETLLEVFCLCTLYSVKIKATYHPAITIIIYIITGTIFSYIFPPAFVWIILFPMTFFAYKQIFKKSITEIFFSYIFVYLFIGFVEQIYVLIFNKFEIKDWRIMAIIGSTASFISTVILFKLIPVHKLYNYLNNSSTYIKFSIYNLFILYLIKIYLSKYTNYDTAVMLPLLISYAIVICATDYLLIKQQRTIARQQESLENYQTYEPMMDSLIEDIRRRQHDFSNELNAINMISCTYNNYESLSHALNEHAEHLTRDFHSTDLVHLNMKVLAGFLHSKKSTAAAEKKDLDIKINSYVLNSQMPEYELIKVVGILIDNALEATDEDGTVKLEIGSRDDKLAFATVNKGPKLTPKLRSDMVKAGYTTKEPACSDKTNGKRKRPAKRGYGLANALDLLTEYGGELYIENPESDGDTLIRFEFIV